MAIVIVGAGIGDIAVDERGDELKPLGVGLNLLPHAVRELTELDRGERIEGLGAAPGTLAYHNRHGQLIWNEPCGRDAGYQWPQASVHRGRLQTELLAAR
ncbi:hypothetical protein ACTI_44530 [Actinoplanes sp. OR16]|uniref:hypothetical protein n=1 Tax=Actinoplanes sp. OR16 TaxID=946334 RepID=UPI000F6BBA90|nr:hypothetical protein [Actinoplanes sp. OR16]BBH67768.1 hypothetical protein ACTI_44530 [Actinoplanes sp. OR16]